jgi:Icc-related predicted phosphoesterase
MIVAHVSDTHGQFPLIPKCAEVVVHSGDMLPNMSRGNLDIEIPFQTSWVSRNVEKYRKWLGDRPMIASLGNHDFIDPVVILRKAGMKTVNIDLRHYTYNDVTFYGFPFIPYIKGEWHLECRPEDMLRHIRRLADEFATKPINVLVAHCPPRGVRDCYEGEHVGNHPLLDFITYGLDAKGLTPPRWIFSGHIHQDNGRGDCGDIKVSNAATVVRLIEL